METMVAQLCDVQHHYGKNQVLKSISVDIAQGVLTGIIGPDGVGKSTLLGLLAGVKRLQHGTITVFDEDITDKHARSKLCQRVAYMPQGLGKNLYPSLSIYDNLSFFATLFSHSKQFREQRITQLLAATGLTPFSDRPVAKLSGGMKQKLGLCCALIHDPDLLILDEPTTGVDPLSRRQFWHLLTQLRELRPTMSVIVATAYMEEAQQFDWLAMVNGGSIIATGQPQTLLADTKAASLDTAFIRLLGMEGHTHYQAPASAAHRPVSHDIVIKAENLTRSFNGFVAVDNVSFDIHRGEIFGFLGSNGCGKTTTMKMLTGLLPASNGQAHLFGKPINVKDINSRRRIGYMSQNFSLYDELSVRQNLQLHGRVFGLHGQQLADAIAHVVQLMGLEAAYRQRARELPLGIRQRLSLAVAVIHSPDMLILDEPTSGVDPVARDHFWSLLLMLSRDKGVTIFVSTHYMNEALRCDRLSLMHAGKVLEQGTPQQLIDRYHCQSLEQAFICVLEKNHPSDTSKNWTLSSSSSKTATQPHSPLNVRRTVAYAYRESRELLREPLRLLFALIAPLFLLIVLGYGISFDVEDLHYAVLDRNQSPASREYLQQFSASRYFLEQAALTNYQELEQRLASGDLIFAIEIPPDFGRQLDMQLQPSIGIWINGSLPFHAERTRNFITAIHNQYALDLLNEQATSDTSPAYRFEVRFRYNQAMSSIYAIVPAVIAVLMTLIPAMLTAVAVVREKELGSITNFYTTPTNRLEFLLGKQLPYVLVGLINYVSLLLLARYYFAVPFKGEMLTVLLAGLIYAWTASALGLLISAFVRTQIAALFAAMIITMIPSINFSGMIKPVSSLEGAAATFGTSFPAGYLMNITVGCFTKGLQFMDLWKDFIIITLFFVVFTVASLLSLQKQEP